MGFRYQYKYSIENILSWLSDPPLPTKKNEEAMRGALREIELRLARMDLGGHNSLSLDRIASQLEEVLKHVQEQLRQYEREYHYAAEDEEGLNELPYRRTSVRPLKRWRGR